MQGHERQDLLAHLVHADEELRRLAVERTTLLPAEEAVPLLIERLGDSSWRVRKAAAARLSHLPDRANAVSALLEAIADGTNPGRRNAAIEALVACGRGATLALLGALASPDVDVRKQAVDVLGAIRDARAEPALVATLDDSDPNVRAAAADALAGLGSGASGGPLRRLASGDPDRLVRLAALRALVQLEAPIPLPTIEGALADPMLAPAGYAALAQSEEPAVVDVILKGLLAGRASIREAAARAATTLASRADAAASELEQRVRELAAAHAEIAREVSERIERSTGSARLASVQFAALLRSVEAVRALTRCSDDAVVSDAALGALAALGGELPSALGRLWPQLDARERAFCCASLARCGASHHAERMLRGVLSDASSEVRGAAAHALAACASDAALGDLLGRLANEDPCESREAAEREADALVDAASELAQRGGDEATEAAIGRIETHLLHGGERARRAGARLLARLARPVDGARVRALFADPNEDVRCQAVEATLRLGRAGDELLRVALADEAPPVRAAAAHVVVALGTASADDDLAALAQDRDARVRCAALAAAALRVEPLEVRARTVSLLAGGLREDGVVALAALDSLNRVGGADAAGIAALALRSAEPEIVERAVACVGAHGGATLRSELIALLGHPAWPVRARVASELAAQRAASAAPHLYARLSEERDDFVREALLAALAALER